MKVWGIAFYYFWEDVDPVSEIIAFYDNLPSAMQWVEEHTQDEKDTIWAWTLIHQDENEVCYRNRDHMISIVSYEVLS